MLRVRAHVVVIAVVVAGLVALPLVALLLGSNGRPRQPPDRPKIEAKQKSDRPPTTNGQPNANADDTKTAEPSIGESHPKATGTDPSEYARKGGEEASEYWVILWRRVKITDTLLVLFSFLLFIGTMLLWLSTRKAADAAKLSADALASAERAHLFVRVTSQNVELIVTNAARLDLSAEWDSGTVPRIQITYVIKNFGKTPAILKEINHALEPMVDLPTKPQYSEPRGLPDNRVLGEGEETLHIVCTCEKPVTLEEARNIAAGKCSIWLIGRVVYEDIVTNSERIVPFLYRYAGAGFNPDYRRAYNERS